jgi:hypothetical protein
VRVLRIEENPSDPLYPDRRREGRDEMRRGDKMRSRDERECAL